MSITPGKVNDKTNSDQSFVTALVVNGALLFIEVGAFLILKERLGRIYSPRTFLPPPESAIILFAVHSLTLIPSKRATELRTGPFGWLLQVLSLPTHDIVSVISPVLTPSYVSLKIEKNGLDA
jgi:calcium permeable stress-gated cation channel